MRRRRRRSRMLLALALCLAPGLACGFGDRVDAAGFRDYGQELCRASGVEIAIRSCAMAPAGTRLGLCEASGAGADRLPGALGLTSADAETTSGWAGSPNSGCAEGGWTAAHPDARLYLVPEGAVPPSHGRGKLHRIWIEGSEVCFDLSYPYG